MKAHSHSHPKATAGNTRTKTGCGSSGSGSGGVTCGSGGGCGGGGASGGNEWHKSNKSDKPDKPREMQAPSDPLLDLPTLKQFTHTDVTNWTKGMVSAPDKKLIDSAQALNGKRLFELATTINTPAVIKQLKSLKAAARVVPAVPVVPSATPSVTGTGAGSDECIECWLGMNDGSRQAISSKISKLLTQYQKLLPIVSWCDPYDVKTVQILIRALIRALDAIESNRTHEFDPPIGDGQCQIRAARNTRTLNILIASTTAAVRGGINQIRAWREWFTSLTASASVLGKTELAARIEAGPAFLAAGGAASGEEYASASDVWYLLSCYVVTLGKVVSETSTNKVTHNMSTDLDRMSESLERLSKPATQFIVRVLRDFIAKESVRYLRYQCSQMSQLQMQSLGDVSESAGDMVLARDGMDWWSPERAGIAVGQNYTRNVRGGWPAVPMFWSYASLLYMSFETTPIVVLIKRIGASASATEEETILLNPWAAKTHSTGWIVQGACSSDMKFNSEVHNFQWWVRAILLSAADHPQYPVETTSEEYKSFDRNSAADVDTIPANRRSYVFDTAKAAPSAEASSEVLVSEFMRAKMQTEEPAAELALAPYNKYRDAAIESGCSIHKPTKFVIQHVYPGPVAMAGVVGVADQLHPAIAQNRSILIDYLQ